jgi:hypothetical protein
MYSPKKLKASYRSLHSWFQLLNIRCFLAGDPAQGWGGGGIYLGQFHSGRQRCIPREGERNRGREGDRGREGARARDRERERYRGSIGDNSILGDARWGGMYGIDADFVANENCKICCFSAEHIVVRDAGAYSAGRDPRTYGTEHLGG